MRGRKARLVGLVLAGSVGKFTVAATVMASMVGIAAIEAISAMSSRNAKNVSVS